MTYDFIVTFGLEELPYNIILTIVQSFMDVIRKGLSSIDIIYGSLYVLYTPRKLVLKANKLSKTKTNIYTALYGIIYSSLKAFTSFKSMCWNVYEKAFKFIRPLHTLTILLNNKLMIGSILGVSSNRFVNGHRYIGSKRICINHANNYIKLLLEKGKVLSDYRLRLKVVHDKVNTIAKPKGVVKLDSILLTEVTNMVEWTTVYIGSFNKSFLIIPKELLVFIIKANQKYLPLYETAYIHNHKYNLKLLPHYIAVSNIIPNRYTKTISDSQKIIRSRLVDAIYFISKDRYICLEQFTPDLNTIVFEKSLGSLREKNLRVEYISSWVSQHIESNHIATSRAGLISKCDLATKLVYEFKELYGYVGMYHTNHDNESKEVSLALMEHYKPRFSNDMLPTSLVGCSVGLSDKADSLIGLIGINGVPKGNKDPYSSKRLIIGILRIVIEKKLILNLKELIRKSVSTYGSILINKSLTYIIDAYYIKKLKGWYQSLGYNNNTICSVLALSIEYPLNIHSRICLLKQLQKLKNFKYIIEANKRLTNIIIKLSYINNSSKVNMYLLRSSEEVIIYKQHIAINKKICYLLYSLSLSETSLLLINLAKSICDLFKSVYIIDSPNHIRNNRLVLLNSLKDTYLYIANILYIN